MSIVKEEEIKIKALKETGEKMMLAARTAPKARGVDNLEIAMLEGDSIISLAEKMKEIGEKMSRPFFLRDAANIRNSPVVILIGTKIRTIGLKEICGLCGFENCDEKEKHPSIPCIYNTNDLGIAIGSAVSIAADNRVDCRVMFSAGRAALESDLLGADVKIIFAIPLSASGKSPYFDR
ncbi:MAG: ferredoxin [Bacteroidales bacterium]|nr:ferredoxin [Bacteroidales bacterium]